MSENGRTNWRVERDFECSGGIVVRVECSGLRYSLKVGRYGATKDRIIPYLPLSAEWRRDQHDQVVGPHLKVDVARTAAAMLVEAQDYVLQRIKERCGGSAAQRFAARHKHWDNGGPAKRSRKTPKGRRKKRL